MNTKILIFFACFVSQSLSLDNGLALTPPMGWLTWSRYRCTIDCMNRPNECISEALMMKTADYLASNGFLEAGYEYLGINDCWSEFERDENDRLVANKERFPNGMKYLVDYVHSKGLKFGIHGDYGTHTCSGYPGSINHMEIDAETFGNWGVDYVKFDGCNIDIDKLDEGYPYFGKLLNETGRSMLYSCSWPAYQEMNGIMPDYDLIKEHCNIWRNWYDVADSWGSIDSIMDHFGEHSRRFATYAGPGHWNDPDMIMIGNFGLSFEQEKVQMAVWSILAAPLLMSNDLTNLNEDSKALLLNKDIIAVNQDPLGRAGIRVLKRNSFAAWKREVVPIVNNQPSIVIAIVNHSDYGSPRVGKFTFEELEINPNHFYIATDLLPSPAQTWKVVLNGVNSSYIETSIVPRGVTMIKLQA